MQKDLLKDIKQLLVDWAQLKEDGDVNLVAKLIDKSHSTASKILAGKQSTSIKNILKIKALYDKRRALFEKINAA